MSTNDIKFLKDNIDKLVDMVTEFNSKKMCIAALLSSTYLMLIEMNNQPKEIDAAELGYLMGHLLPLLEVVLKDEAATDKEFNAAVSIRMREYYAVYLRDIELSGEISDIIKNRSMH